jgi:membrane protease YdiL (CAAX protease family)
MFLFALQSNTAILIAIFSIMVLGFLLSWGFLIYRRYEGKSFLPRYEPRRPVPWNGWDLLLIFLLYWLLLFVFHSSVAFAEKAGKPKAVGQQEAVLPSAAIKTPLDKTTVHPLAQLLKDKSPAIFVLCFAVGVVIVPIFEEVFFRLFFTGWLLAAERPWRQKWRDFYGPRGVLPIHISALIFAMLHYRTESPEVKEVNIIVSMSLQAAASLLTLAFAVGWMVFQRGATARDLGWDGRKWPADLVAGSVAFFSTAVPIYALQIALGQFLPKEIAPDPIVLYFFAIFLGALYFRTSRILPSIVMHMLLNACSLGLAWAMM